VAQAEKIMAVRSLDSADPGSRRVPLTEFHAHAVMPFRDPLRPRLAAIAPRAAEAVRFAGGWLFDQVMAGWDVTVLAADHADPRPLQILGVRTADLETVLARQVRGSCLQAMAVNADLCDGDARVRRMVRQALGGGQTEVRLWGGRWPEDLDGVADPVRHRLSVAARAFKAQALAAAAVPAGPSGDTEVFQQGAIRPATQVPAP
jgi:hypothetical protein